MSWPPRNFDEACRLASARRAYNKRRRLARARRISAIFRALDSYPNAKGCELAAALKVSEATISRDLRFVRQMQKQFAEMIPGALGPYRMTARNFFWGRDALGHGLVFEIRNGVRVR